MIAVNLFMVYGRDDELVGVSEDLGDRRAIHVKKNGGILDIKLKESRLPGYLAELSRKGFVLRPKLHFFNEELGGFSLMHPDFPEKPGANYVLFIQPENIESAIAGIDEIAAGCGGLKKNPNYRQWVGEKLMSSDFLVADASDPRWALLLAEMAHRSALPITPARSGLPETAPSADPLGWQGWLKKFFDVSSIVIAQGELGWTVSKLLSQTQVNSPDGEKLVVDFL